jgi:hypothetical protein
LREIASHVPRCPLHLRRTYANHADNERGSASFFPFCDWASLCSPW